MHMKKLFSEIPYIEGERLVLKQIEDKDADVQIITASTMVENQASAHVLQKNGFTLVNHAVDEDWGFPNPTPADKWIC